MSSLTGLRVCVVGLGPMGRGIAEVFARSGAAVTVHDATPELTEKGSTAIREALAKDDIDASVNELVEDAQIAEHDLMIEAIVEDMDAKREFLERTAKHASEDLIVASNTSSLSIGEMGQAYGRPERFVGMHFFNPPTKMRLVELIRGAQTTDQTVEVATGWVEGLNKTPVVCADSPNFIVNRICRPLYYEAQLLTTQGIKPAVVDAVARLALGHPMGPLQLLDFTGLHTHLASSETALREFGDPRYRPIPRVRQLVRAGLTGRAAGRGFYDYTSAPPREAQQHAVREPTEVSAVPVAVTGPGAAAYPTLVAGDEGTTGSSDATITVYACGQQVSSDDEAEVHQLAAAGRTVVVDSSSARWRTALPSGMSWIRAQHGRDGAFVEVVDDELARITPQAEAYAVVDALQAPSVRVPALPGLVTDRLRACLINEAMLVIEEGTATAEDVDLALRHGMNHPAGPLELLEQYGPAAIAGVLLDMLEGFGDPRYRPTQLLLRMAAGMVRT